MDRNHFTLLIYVYQICGPQYGHGSCGFQPGLLNLEFYQAANGKNCF
jgi:hypothetical protein